MICEAVSMVRKNMTVDWFDSTTSKVVAAPEKVKDHNQDLINEVDNLLGIDFIFGTTTFNPRKKLVDRYKGGKQYKWFDPTFLVSASERTKVSELISNQLESVGIQFSSVEWIQLGGLDEYASRGVPTLVIKVADPVKEKVGEPDGHWEKNEVTRRWEYVKVIK
jgi:hypothetical protein